MPSKKETFGMVTVEAMLSSKPVIGTNSGGTPELLVFGKLGQLFEYQNQEDLVSKVENILLDKYNYHEQIEKAKSIAINQYDSKVMCNSLEKLLK
jgi:glycosyltransferase involved in cell wall biosynthesis